MEDTVKFELRYIVIPDYVYQDNRLSVIDLKVYGFIHSYTNPFFFSNEHLAKMFNCHYETISTSIGKLEELGYIKTEYRVKASGGKVRLSVDAYSDSVQTLSRIYKDNNLKKKEIYKEKESGKEEVSGVSETSGLLEARHERHARKGKGLGGNPTSREKPEYKKFKKIGGVTDAKNII